MNGSRAYLDWNATAPLRPEAREAMLAAMDAVGNPSSVHGEGRAAKAIVEKARGQVAALVGCEPGEVVFNSGATEAAHMVVSGAWKTIWHTGVEHDCIDAPVQASGRGVVLPLDPEGILHPKTLPSAGAGERDLVCVQAANSETGITQNVFDAAFCAREVGAALLTDCSQSMGKRSDRLDSTGMPDFALASAHKIGGPKGVGLLVVKEGRDLPTRILGGGQELRRRSGTENVIGIAGFGATAEAALRDLENGAWERVENLRNILESRLADAAPDLHVIGKDAPRLPNTSCFAVRGWKGETQVMQMDLAGFAVSAGSACSSGKVGPSRVLRAMGYDEEMATSAIRVSIGPTTTEAEVTAFAEAWIDHYHRRRQKSAA